MRSTSTLSLVGLLLMALGRTSAGDRDLIPPQLSKPQQENLLKFLERQPKPDRFVPKDAKLVDAPASGIEGNADPKPGQIVKQYTVQMTPHRPVPGQEVVKNVDIYYYRPNPEKGKRGVTIKQTVDATTGEQVGPTEVLFKHHTPVAREELDEAVALAKEKSAEVQALYKDRDKSAVRWEYLQMKINKKSDAYDPGDRVVRLVYTATPNEGEAAPKPVAVVVNLTKVAVLRDMR